MNKRTIHLGGALLAALVMVTGCSGGAERTKITSLDQMADKEFAIPTGTVVDKLVNSKLPNAKFKYFNNVLDAALAVKTGKADAAAYDEPILRNIAGKTPA